MIKFTRGWDYGFLGAEVLSDKTEPYYSNTELGTIILDGNGVTLFVYDNNSDETVEYTQTFSVDSTLAQFIIDGLALVSLETWVEKFKTNPKTEIAVY